MLGDEHLRRHVAGPTARVVNVEGMEKLDQPAPLKGCQPQDSWKKLRMLAAQAAHEVQRDIETELEHVIKRQEDGRTPSGVVILHSNMNLARFVGE